MKADEGLVVSRELVRVSKSLAHCLGWDQEPTRGCSPRPFPLRGLPHNLWPFLSFG